MNSSLVIPIHKNYAEKILSGVKRYEYRKIMPKRDIDYLVLCETRTHGEIVAVAEVSDILRLPPYELWQKTMQYSSGISRDAFWAYFQGASLGIAFCLGNIWRPQIRVQLADFGIANIPQSIRYISSSEIKHLLAMASITMNA